MFFLWHRNETDELFMSLLTSNKKKNILKASQCDFFWINLSFDASKCYLQLKTVIFERNEIALDCIIYFS